MKLGQTHTYSCTHYLYGIFFLWGHYFSQRTTLKTPIPYQAVEKSRRQPILNSEIISDNVLSTGREIRQMCIFRLLGESDNQISLLSFLSRFYIHIKTGIFLKYWFFFLLFHTAMFYSVGQMLKICDLGFVILTILFSLNTSDLFSPSRNIKDKRRTQPHFKNMKIFIYLVPGHVSQDHRAESSLKRNSSQPVATLTCSSNWAIRWGRKGRPERNGACVWGGRPLLW